jgi:carbamoyltransferase
MKKPFIVLGIYEVHNASACLMIDGKIIAASHEERFSKIKNDVGMPIKAAKFCMSYANIKPKDIDKVVLSNDSFNKNGVANILLKRPALYSIDDWIIENKKYWKNKLLHNKKNPQHYFDIMQGKKKLRSISHYYDLKNFSFNVSDKKFIQEFNEIRKKTVSKYLGIKKDKIEFLEHFICHHYHAYYSSPYRGKKVVVAHLEGDGGKFNNAVSIPTKRGLKILAGSKTADIGRLYQWVTLILGMRPYHDEYKVMGLAPYATNKEVLKSLKVFQNLFKLTKNKMAITYKAKPKDLYFTISEMLKGNRFDGIAGALQITLEQIVIKWLSSVQKKTKRKILCYGGGVAMNVKANGKLNQINGFKNIFVPISPSDETNAIGACYYATEQHFLRNNLNPDKIKPLISPYLGPELDDKDLLKKIKKFKKGKKIKLINNFKNNQVINYLMKGKVIGRASGRAEFGQRALGNRSIIANPLIKGIEDKINFKIKYRDFWMPFCPTILKEKSHQIIINRKNNLCEFMTTSFDVKKDISDKLNAGIHHGDKTMRPQILDKKTNKDFYQLIEVLYKKTKVPIILNTSLNLHRKPMATDLDDIFDILKNSDLDGMIINNKFLIIERDEK